MDEPPGVENGPGYGAAEFVTALSLSDVPGRVLDRARLLIADTLGAVIGGVDVAPMRGPTDRWADGGAASIPGTRCRTSP
jgi:2-methylcitrate dehydratase PrpD